MHYFVVIILTLFCFNCKSKDDKLRSLGHNQPFDDDFELVAKEDKTFALDTLTSAQKISYDYYQDKTSEREDFYILNRLNLRLQIYNWKNGQLLRTIKLEKEGPNGVGNAEQLLVVSPDSIFLLDAGGFKLSLIDANGKMKTYFRLFATKNKHKIAHPIAKIPNKLKLINNHLFICGHPMSGYYSQRAFYADGQIGLDIDLRTREVSGIMPMPDYFVKRFDNGYKFCIQHMTWLCV